MSSVELLRCVVGDLPITYLGLPLGRNAMKVNFGDPVMERMSKRLDGWKMSFISFVGVKVGQAWVILGIRWVRFPREPSTFE